MLSKPKGTKRFFFHYNKQHDCWSVHFSGQCFIVEEIECSVPKEGHKQNIQPRRIIRGWAQAVIVTPDKKAIIQ